MMSVPKNNGPIVDPALCRCCRAIKKCRILTAEYTWMGKKEIYADMVMDCYGILLSHVDGNERDSGVCATCVVRLREAIAFRHQVLQCEELFLQAKLEHHDEEEEKDETKLKKFDLELKTEPKDYSSDHNSIDDRDEPCAGYSDDDAEDDKPLKKEEPKPEEPPPLKSDDLKSEESEFHGDSSSDSDEPIKKKMKRKAKEAKAKANGAKKKIGKAAKKQKAETGNTETSGSETLEKIIEIYVPQQETELSSTITNREITAPELHMVIKVEPCSETSVTITETTETLTGTETGTKVPVKKRMWVRPLAFEKTEYQLLCEELELNEELYFKHYNMSKDSFEDLLGIVEKSIHKVSTNFLKRIKPRLRLSIFLRYLITGDSFVTVAKSYGIGRSSAASIIVAVSKALFDVLQPIYMPTPTTETWLRCEEAFQEVWQIPNCIGSVSGRHIIARSKVRLQPSQYSQTRLKRYTSAVFLAVADPLYNLVLIDIGNYGKQDDRGLLEHTSFYKDFLRDAPLLPAIPLPGGEKAVPRFFIGNEGLPLTSFMLREYPRSKEPSKIKYNDRIGAARTVESVFDMLMANWRVFRYPLECSVESGVHFAKAACCLHNFVRQKHGGYLVEGVEVRKKGKGKLMKGLVPFRPMCGRGPTSGVTARNRLAEYFSGGSECVEASGVEVEPQNT